MPLTGSRPKTPVAPQNASYSGPSNRSSGATRKRRLSENFYEDGGTEDLTNRNEISIEQSDQIKKFHTRQSKKLPHWAWRILVVVLGIKKHESDRIIVGQIMLAITVLVAGIFAASFIWYTVYDIYSEYTKSNALTGTVSIILVLFWCALGIYANRLLRNLFKSRKLVESVRLHSKTVFKVSASFMMLVLGVAVTVLNNLSAQSFYSDHQCRNISLSIYVCRTIVGSRIGYSVFSLIWNIVVGFVVLSVCRTHTIGIRRFIRELEEDGRLYEHMFRQEIMDQLQKSGDFQASGQHSSYTTTDEYFTDQEEEDHWAEDDPLVDDLTFYPRPSTASLTSRTGSITRARSHWAIAKRKLLQRQDSISSLSAAIKFRPHWRISSTSSINRSARSSRPNSGGSSQEDEVFPQQTTSQQPQPRSYERPSLGRQMETLVEQSLETLNTAGASNEDALNKQQSLMRGQNNNVLSGGALGESPELSSGFTKDQNSVVDFSSQESRTKMGQSQPEMQNLITFDIDTRLDPVPMEQELKPITHIGVEGMDENYYGNKSDDDDVALLTSSDGCGTTGTKGKDVKIKHKKTKDKKRHHSKNGKEHTVHLPVIFTRGKNPGVKCTRLTHFSVLRPPKKQEMDDISETSDPCKKDVNVSKVIESIKGRQSVDGAEKDMKDKINTYVSDCSSDDEAKAPCDQQDLQSHCSWEDESPLLTNEEIFLAHWKINCRLRSTSIALQRWLFMWITLILIWSASFLVELVSHDTRIVEIAQFILTILLIPLICSAYGEINYEGARMIKSICPLPSRINMLKLLVNMPLEMTCICPTPCRVDLLFVLIHMPLEMTAFGFAVNYSSIVTTIGALGLAFFTKLLLDDIRW